MTDLTNDVKCPIDCADYHGRNLHKANCHLCPTRHSKRLRMQAEDRQKEQIKSDVFNIGLLSLMESE